MGIDARRYPNPAAGYHHIACERRFMWIEPDPEAKTRDTWLQHPVTCPICAADTGLVLVFERGDSFVQVLCPNGHEWPEPLVTPQYFVAYSEQRYFADPDPHLLWILAKGFGEEPEPPIDDHVEQIARAAKDITKYAGRKAKTRAKRAVRKPLRTAKKKALNVAFAPVAAALRAAWIMQSGGVPQQAPKGRGKRRHPEDGMKIPTAAAYRKALGVPAQKKGPHCLVCRDTGRITAPGVSIPCTECLGAAAPLARAEEKARRVREGSGSARAAKTTASRTRRRTTTSKNGVTNRADQTVTGPTAAAGPRSAGTTAAKARPAAQSGAAAAEAAARAAFRPGVTVVTGVVNIGNGRTTGSVQETHVSGSHQQVNARADGRPPAGGRAPTAAEAASVRDALKSAARAVRESAGRSSSTVQVSGRNNSVITTTTDGDAVHITGDR